VSAAAGGSEAATNSRGDAPADPVCATQEEEIAAAIAANVRIRVGAFQKTLVMFFSRFRAG
jgi:hypothetical protein